MKSALQFSNFYLTITHITKKGLKLTCFKTNQNYTEIENKMQNCNHFALKDTHTRTYTYTQHINIKLNTIIRWANFNWCCTQTANLTWTLTASHILHVTTPHFPWLSVRFMTVWKSTCRELKLARDRQSPVRITAQLDFFQATFLLLICIWSEKSAGLLVRSCICWKLRHPWIFKSTVHDCICMLLRWQIKPRRQVIIKHKCCNAAKKLVEQPSRRVVFPTFHQHMKAPADLQTVQIKVHSGNLSKNKPGCWMCNRVPASGKCQLSASWCFAP